MFTQHIHTLITTALHASVLYALNIPMVVAVALFSRSRERRADAIHVLSILLRRRTDTSAPETGPHALKREDTTDD